MSPIDAVLLASLLALAAWRLIAPRRGRQVRTIACVIVVLLAGLQYALHGYTWQFLAGYLLLAATALPVRDPGRMGRVLGAIGLGALMTAALASWAILPAPTLPKPTGSNPVGSVTMRWVDPDRDETATPEPGDRRNVIVQAWYPAAPGAAGPRPPYIDGLGRLPQTLSGVPRFIFRRFGEADIHAVQGAPMAAGPAWPVILFSPGYGAPRAFYAGLAADLASRGYVVLAVDHPFEVAVTQLADGRVAAPAQDEGRTDADRVAYMNRQVLVRAADLRFVLDQLTRPNRLPPILAGRLDPSRVAAAGHSFGGATAALVASQDPRIGAAADIDGMLYGDVRGETFRGPFLLVESDRTEAIGPYMAATQVVMSRVSASGWRYAIGGANHFSFTDADRFFSPPGRWAMSKVMGGERGGPATQAATADILDAFLRAPLKGQRGDVAAAAARHPFVRGGPAS
jgi:predicted dienelactone hydrolase